MRKLVSAAPLLGTLLLAAAIAGAGETPSPRPLDLDGKAVDPFRGDAAATVFLFAAVECPISNRYAPEVRRIHEAYAPRDVAFWLVYADPDTSPEAIRRHIDDFSYTIPALRDTKHALVELTGVEITPEAAVFNADRELIYHGRIDDWYVAFGKKRAKPTVRDLQEALDAALDGRAPERATAPAVGCYIPSLE